MTNHHPLSLIGSGCASLSLAKAIRAENLGTCKLLTDSSYLTRPNHIWGFWSMPWLKDASEIAPHTWHKWQIITSSVAIIHESHIHPYQAISSYDWLHHCATQSGAEEVIGTITTPPSYPYFDSRPLTAPQGCFYQHFIGHHIKTKTPVFNDTTAILMDFRCDQSEGLHFIYLLPTSPTTALVESTLFSPDLVPDDYYETAIKTYLLTCHNCDDYQVMHKERGIIPLADCRDTNQPETAIGARGGALRPSSGYAFSFIQKQVLQIITHYQNTQIWQSQSPISATDLWMDKVFLQVLASHPHQAISVFERMARALSGDEFATFMSGTASFKTVLKVVMAMPKWPFLKAAISPDTYRSAA